MKRISLDIETACALGCQVKCEHALDEHRNRISVIGVFSQDDSIARVFRNIDDLRSFLEASKPYTLVGHNLKFDLRTLAAKGLDLRPHWGDDTLLMAATLTEKIPNSWLERYEARRREENAKLSRGHSHRQAGQHSLKTLAPYFLGVEPFWETPESHDNDEYVLTDCRHTLALSRVLEEKLRTEGSYGFYKDKLLPWSRLLLDMEMRGVRLDLDELEHADTAAKEAAAKARVKIDELWKGAYVAHWTQQASKLANDYDLKLQARLSKVKDGAKTEARYRALFDTALAKLPRAMNLDSPAQLAWILRDHFKLDISDFHGEEGTGKAILNRLADEGREDIRTFLEYRKQQKLSTAFFPSYRAMQHEGALHCSFNPTGTRTGRLSSSGPNLQQVPGHLHKLFCARPGYKLATYDLSAIEPRLIAYYSDDKALFDIIATGQDFHGYNTKIFFELDEPVADIKHLFPTERKMGKEVGLSLFYGAGAGRLQETALKYGFRWSKNECYRKLERFKEFYAGVYQYRDEVLNPHLAMGNTVPNLFGRFIRIPDPDDVHMQGLNTLIQSSASDLMVNSVYQATREFRKRAIDAHVLLLVHDEAVTEVPEARVEECQEILVRNMTGYLLTTEQGQVKLAVEGKVSDTWEK